MEKPNVVLSRPTVLLSPLDCAHGEAVNIVLGQEVAP
jgi:hypothetical protein